MTLEEFLEARLKEDTSLPLDDILTKHHIVGIFHALGNDDAGELDKDAWIVAREIVFLLCQRYADHPDYNPAWKPVLALAVPQQVRLASDTQAKLDIINLKR